MKVTVINGNARHGSTWHCREAFLAALEKHEAIEVMEFTLPKDMPNFCLGCFSCIYNGENTCPHAASVRPIVTALEDADLILLTSPVYVLDVSGQMKALLDHLGFMWLSHRPNPKMFGKVGFALTTAAGAGLSHTTKTLKDSLRYWGVKKVFSYGGRVAASSWNDIPEAKQQKIAEKLGVLADKVL